MYRFDFVTILYTGSFLSIQNEECNCDHEDSKELLYHQIYLWINNKVKRTFEIPIFRCQAPQYRKIPIALHLYVVSSLWMWLIQNSVFFACIQVFGIHEYSMCTRFFPVLINHSYSSQHLISAWPSQHGHLSMAISALPS